MNFLNSIDPIVLMICLSLIGMTLVRIYFACSSGTKYHIERLSDEKFWETLDFIQWLGTPDGLKAMKEAGPTGKEINISGECTGIVLTPFKKK